MNKPLFDKQPAFFRAMSPELFFEAESVEAESVITDNAALNAKLEQLLSEQSDADCTESK